MIGNLNSRIYTASEGDLTVQGGTGARSYAQIGLGGHDDVAGAGDIEGDKNGMIVVFSRLGDINVTGGTTAGAYGQVGHGGLNNDGNFLHENLGLFVQSGWNTTPVAGPPAGDLTVTSNVGYGMIGSGDAIPAGTGDRVGLVFTSSTGNTNDFGQIGHMTAAGIRSARSGSVNLTAGDYTIGTTGTYRETGAEVVARVLAADYMVGAGGSIFINEDVTFASGNTLSLAARDNIYVYASIQNSQAVDGGDVNLFAGWDGVTGLGKAPFIYVNVPPAGLSFDPALVIADPASYGIGDGITQGLIQFGDGTQTNAIGVGSRSGATRVLGHTLDMNAGTAAGAHAQIGFHIISATGNSASGDITVAMTGDISMDGGSQDGAYVQIGHGALYVTGTSLAGDISVTTTTGGVTVNGGTALDTFGMIGHGGVFTRANKSGSILVQAGGGDVALTSGGGERAFTQIGHGGVGSGGTATLGLAGDLIDVIAFNDIIIRASDTGLRAYSQIGNGGFDSDAPTLAGNVRVVALNDLTVTGGGADQAFAQIGNGGGSTDGNKEGIIIVSAGDGLLAGNVTLTRGAGSDSFAKIGHGDQAFTTGAGGAGGDSGAGTIDGDIQVTAGESVVSTGGMIGHVDTSLGGPAVANSGSTFIAVSRNDFPATMATGDGTLTADATSVFASAPGGELRFYLPRRDSNLIAPGALLNGTPYGGAPVDPAFQLPTEFAAGPDQLAFGQHTNLNTAAANAAGLVLNLDPIDAASYGGAFSFYYDNIDVNVPPPAPPAPPAPPVPPAPPIFVTIDGQLFFNQNVLAPGSPFVQAGPFSTVFTDDYFNSDNQRYDLQIFDAGDKKGWYRAVGAWTSSFDTIYSTVEGGPAWSSFTEFGDGSRPTSGYSEYFNSLNSQSEQDDELRSLLENLEAELAELRGLGDSSE